MKLIDSTNLKILQSENYNYFFNKNFGYFARWGEKEEDNPIYSPFGPEILDMEIDSGECMGNCGFCYKQNGSGVPKKFMTLDKFKKIIDKVPKTLTQIAFGITNIGSNPDFFPIMEYTRSIGIIPNYTCHGLDVNPEYAKKTAKLCGAVAVSIRHKENSYNSIKMFVDAGMKQVNIHYMLSEETYDRAFNIIKDIKEDPRLKGMKAIVFLQYKPKGRGINVYNCIFSYIKYKRLIDWCNELDISYGFDSCSAPLFFRAIKNHSKRDQLIQMVEPCESGLFSFYCNVDGEFFPCSFSEGTEGWKKGINWNFDKNIDFIKDIWNHEKLCKWREKLLESSKKCSCDFVSVCRSCPIYKEVTCKKI